jgi:membrane-bound lytic murein transglycosylase D
VRNGFQMRGSGDPSLVSDWETYYSSRQDYFSQLINNSSHFLYHVANEVERRGMPLEIALLPMIESAYNPVAYSSAHASGIWQFIPSTGKHYGLKQNWWYDGRRDVIAATGAALDYLQVLHGMFNDWELALAAYNWGEGAVQRAIERNQAKGLGTDFLSLAAGMPAETRNYLPKLLAVKNIIANPARYGLTLAAVPNEPYFEVVKLKRHIDLATAARFAGMSIDEFKFLNPAHRKPVINSNSAETVVVPKQYVAAFMASMSQHENKPLVAMKTHTVRAGELPQAIAEQYGISVDELNNLNNVGARRRIATGQTLMVPNADLQPSLDDAPVITANVVEAPRPMAYLRTVMQKVTVMQGGVRRTVLVSAQVSVPHPGRAVGPVPLHRVVAQAPQFVAAPMQRINLGKAVPMQRVVLNSQPLQPVKSKRR